MFHRCTFEPEITRALKDGHWPHGCSPELQAHVNTCATCNDIVLVTEAFQRARKESEQEATPGNPGLVWWRAQLRRRSIATRQITRPITIAQGFALVANVAFAVSFAAFQYHHGLQWASWGSELTPSRLLHLLSLSPANWNLTILLPSLGCLAVLSGLVVYLVTEKP